MSLQHWAIEAAWRHKAERAAPGTSHHIVLELHHSLVVARDGVASFNLLLLSCARSLTAIVSLINSDDPDALAKIALQELPEMPSESALSLFNGSSARNSTLSRVSDSASRVSDSAKVELNVGQSERRAVPDGLDACGNVLMPLAEIEEKEEIESEIKAAMESETKAEIESETKAENVATSEASGPKRVHVESRLESRRLDSQLLQFKELEAQSKSLESQRRRSESQSRPKSQSRRPDLQSPRPPTRPRTLQSPVTHSKRPHPYIPTSTGASFQFSPPHVPTHAELNPPDKRDSVPKFRAATRTDPPTSSPAKKVPSVSATVPKEIGNVITPPSFRLPSDTAKTTLRFSPSMNLRFQVAPLPAKPMFFRTSEGSDNAHSTSIPTVTTAPTVPLVQAASQSMQHNNSSDAGLSPVQLSRPVGPTTSPANLSFIPIFQATRFSSHAPTYASESSESDADTSFKAISSAIRKSLAENASARPPSILVASIPYLADVDPGEVKLELPRQSPVPRQSYSAKPPPNPNSIRPRRTLEAPKRVSAFVPLPEREPIDFRASMRQSIRVKQEHQNAPSGTPAPFSTEAVPPASVSSTTPAPSKAVSHAYHVNFSVTDRSPSPVVLKKAVIGQPKMQTAVNGSPRTRDGSARKKALDRPRAPLGADTPVVGRDTSVLRKAVRVAKRMSPDSRMSPAKKPWSPAAASRQLSKYVANGSGTAVETRSPARPDALKDRMRPKTSNSNKFMVTKLDPRNPPTFVPSQVLEQKLSPNTGGRAAFGALPDLQRSPKNPVSGMKFSSHSVHSKDLDVAVSESTNVPRNTNAFCSPRKAPGSPRKAAALKRLEKTKPSSSAGQNTGMLSKLVTRRKPAGNAVPLPDAARGHFVKDRPREKTGVEQKTPRRKPERSSPTTKNELPDIPSDDEQLRRTKYLKSWAATPEILRVLNEKPAPDPRTIFGDIPVLDIDEIFSSIAPKNGSI